MLAAKETEHIVQTGALFMLGAVAVEAAAMADLPVDDFLTRCEVRDVHRQIKAESLRLKLTGKSRRPHVGGCRPVLGGGEMSITPDETRPLPTKRCSGCGKELHVNQRAIWFDAMAAAPLLLGDCCADRVLGALIQDYAMALKNHSTTWPSHWITRLYPARMTRVAEAAAAISEEYREAIPGIPYALKFNDKTKNRA